jgi:hypothetical protein
VPDRGHHDEVLAEIFIDCFRLGGRFNYYEILGHLSIFARRVCEKVKVIFQIARVGILSHVIPKLVANKLSQSAKFLETMISPSGISNCQVEQFEHARKCSIKVFRVTLLFPSQSALIFTADIAELFGQGHLMPAPIRQALMQWFRHNY